MMSKARDRNEVSDARITVVEIVGWIGLESGEMRTFALADPSHVCGAQAQSKVRQCGLVDEIVALADPAALDPVDVTRYDARDPNDPLTIARVHADTMAGEVERIELNGDVLREDADPDQLEDETEVVR